MAHSRTAATRAQIRRNTYFHRHLALRKNVKQFAVLDSRKHVAEPLRSNIQRSPDSFGTHRFPSVRCQVQAGVARLRIKFSKRLRSSSTFIAANANTDDAGCGLLQICRLVEDARSFFCPKMA